MVRCRNIDIKILQAPEMMMLLLPPICRHRTRPSNEQAKKLRRNPKKEADLPTSLLQQHVATPFANRSTREYPSVYLSCESFLLFSHAVECSTRRVSNSLELPRSRAACWAPSGHNMQQQHITAIPAAKGGRLMVPRNHALELSPYRTSDSLHAQAKNGELMII